MTALVSTNRFFQKLSGLMSAVDVASDSTALGTAESREQASSETSAASTRSRTSASGVPTALMNVMLQPDTGETRISLSSTDRKRGPSEGEEEQSQGFFDVAAFVVRDAIVGKSSDASSEGVQGVPSPPTPGAIFPLANEADADASSQGRIDEAAPRQWMSASESRASTSSSRASVQKGMAHHLLVGLTSCYTCMCVLTVSTLCSGLVGHVSALLHNLNESLLHSRQLTTCVT